jgi:hypothetical protein
MAGSPRVQEEWRARIAAEYTSAAVTQHFVLWLMQLGAPPDLLDVGLAVVADELAHARLSHEVYVAAGGTTPPALDAARLGLQRTSPRLEHDVLHVVVQVYCLGETVAVPLFGHLRAGCSEPIARAALDRILRDEVRHRDFGWDVLDWLLVSPAGPEVPARVTAALPDQLAALERSYGAANAAVIGDDGAMTAADRAWGLAPPREYAEILAATMERDFRPRFAARDITVPP